MPEISTALIIKIIVIVVAIGGGIAVIYSVKKAVSNAIGRQLSRANDLLRTINDATEEDKTTPCSLLMLILMW